MVRRPLRRRVLGRDDARSERHRAGTGDPPSPLRSARGLDLGLEPCPGAERHLWVRTPAQAVFGRAALAGPAQGGIVAAAQASDRSAVGRKASSVRFEGIPDVHRTTVELPLPTQRSPSSWYVLGMPRSNRSESGLIRPPIRSKSNPFSLSYHTEPPKHEPVGVVSR